MNLSIKKILFSSLLIGFFANLFLSTHAVAKIPAGKVIFTKGLVSLTIEGSTAKENIVSILGRGDKFQVGDLISTSKDSKAILKLIDGTQLSLIQNTMFKVGVFSLEKNKEKAELNLLKGGVRAITGIINKHRGGNVKLITPVASIGIRGTDFTSYICDKHCDDENIESINKRKVIKVDTAVKARLIVKKGDVKATSHNNKVRFLYKESPLYEGDVVITGNKSIAVIVFKDDSRITIQANSQFVIEGYAFKPKKAKQSHAKFKLLKGSLRFLTGQIGKLNRGKYSIHTPTSSIGIRGTGFDLAYSNPTHLYLWDGAVNFVYPQGNLVVALGQAYLLANKDTKPKLIKSMPKEFQLGPRPDSKKISEQIDLLYLFGSRDLDGDPGLYLFVKGGEIEAENERVRLNLGTREVGYIGETIAYRINEVPAFLLDRFLPPDADEITLRRLTLLPELFDNISYRDDGNVCQIISDFDSEL